MLLHVLIQTAITEMLKSYRGFCKFLPIKDYTLQLCRLEVSARSQILEISLSNSLTIHALMTQSDCFNSVRCMDLDTQ